jgi:hypothetical protein
MRSRTVAHLLLPGALLLLGLPQAAADEAIAGPRVTTAGEQFVDASGGKVVLIGPNVVMKGPPWIPSVACSGNGHDGECFNCTHFDDTSCQTFTPADITHIRSFGYNFVRLGVIWAGGQPTPDPKLAADFEKRLHAFLDLSDEHGINVLLDIHQDAVGTAVCGEGVPQWFSKLATPDEIGKPLKPSGTFTQKDGSCGANDTKTWAEYAGDADYNIKNRCCRVLNSGASWGALGGSSQAQDTMEYLLSTRGRPHYARYAGLLAAAVKGHPSVVGIELMNEPPTINRRGLFTLWEECYRAIRAVYPTLAVGIMDPSQAALGLGDLELTLATIEWLKEATHLFYAFHWYGFPTPVGAAVENAQNFGRRHKMPALLTEFGGYGGSYGCDTQGNASVAGVGSAYWHYNDYCFPKHCPENGTADGHCPLEGPRWGACITGWGSGNESFRCHH